MGDELQELLKERAERIFESCEVPTSHAVSLALFMYACSDSAMLFPCACLCKWCLSSFVSPSSCSVLLLWCFLVDVTACTMA